MPQSADRLASLEWWLWIVAGVFAVLAPASGLVAYQIGQYRGRLERTAVTRPSLAPPRPETERLAKPPEQHPLGRRITQSQHARLVARLSGHKGARVVVAFVQGDAEGEGFAQQVVDVLKASGWDVEGPGGGNWTPNNPVGHGFVVKDGNAPPDGAILLWGAFKDAGITMGAVAK